MVELEIFATANIIGGLLVAYQIGYVANKCPRRQFQTLVTIMQIKLRFKEFEIFLWKKPGFEFRHSRKRLAFEILFALNY